MDKVNHLSKLLVLLHRDERKLIEKAIACKAQLNQEIQKQQLLQSCLNEYVDKLKNTTQSIPAFKFQHYQSFMHQLEKAIIQQNDVVKRCSMVHLKWLKDLELIKKKIENLNNLIDKEKTVYQIKMDKKEIQQSTDMFNRQKYLK